MNILQVFDCAISASLSIDVPQVQ